MIQLKHPLIKKMRQRQAVFWQNAPRISAKPLTAPISQSDIDEAAERLTRFRPFFSEVFAETAPANGLIESQIEALEKTKHRLNLEIGRQLDAPLYLKRDDALPISGSIKARGGIYEVIKHAEQLALEAGVINLQSDYRQFNSARLRQFFKKYRLVVGSTGNLGLSIGLIGTALGFQVDVHMSADAKTWKKDKLRALGVNVHVYQDDYSAAVAAGRKLAQADPYSHFIDDENSRDLFLGYAVAGRRTAAQLSALNIQPSAENPLYVYLPCGVGGGPGGVAYGLKLIYGDAVKPYFAEPVASPAMLLGLITGQHEKISVKQIGLDNHTAADGLAVGRPSALVSQLMAPLLEGAFTVDDATLFEDLRLVKDVEDIFLEPSALAGLRGAWRRIAAGLPSRGYHLVWATGGSMVPAHDRQKLYWHNVLLA